MISYNELAWTEELLSDPADYEQEVLEYAALLKQYAAIPVQSLLHLGCGAGRHDRWFGEYFTITGVDVSDAMLELARKINPDTEYHRGDMRTIRLNRQFDAVVIPDSIDYMASAEDLGNAIRTAAMHLKPGGVLMITGKTRENFRNNNFAYSGARGDVHVTVLENNFINPYRPDTYDITLVYLIREKGELTCHTENTTGGIFPLATWENLFKKAGLTLETRMLGGLYDSFILGDGEYRLTLFFGINQQH
jgi:SAM-dependent methyltransferase